MGGSGAGLVGGALAAEVGHASTLRPDPSTLGVVGSMRLPPEGRIVRPPEPASAQSAQRSQEVIC